MNEHVLRERGHDVTAGRMAGGIAVHEDDGTDCAAGEERRLVLRDRATHEGDDGDAEGMEAERREIALDDDELVGFGNAVQVEEDVRLPEPLRELVLVLVLGEARVSRPTAGVGDELARLVVDRDADPALHHPAVTEAEAEGLDQFGADIPFREVRMRGVELEREGQRRVDRPLRLARRLGERRLGCRGSFP